MVYPVIFATGAKNELQDSYYWYEEQQKGLGERFLLIIERAVSLLAKFPFAFPEKIKTYREYSINKFPYVMIYEVDNEHNTVYILHIFNTYQNEEKKLRE